MILTGGTSTGRDRMSQWNYKELYTYRQSGPTLQKTHCFSFIKTNLIMLFSTTVTVYLTTILTHKHTVCRLHTDRWRAPLCLMCCGVCHNTAVCDAQACVRSPCDLLWLSLVMFVTVITRAQYLLCEDTRHRANRRVSGRYIAVCQWPTRRHEMSTVPCYENMAERKDGGCRSEMWLLHKDCVEYATVDSR